ncbi:MAG: hypothetical protein KJ042_14625 [Deltaproteobacteria bacterium]|nr:hypothetical protein [Deltaproteobacteria bacterium]
MDIAALTDVLAGVEGAPPEGVALTRLAGDGSDRRYWRANYFVGASPHRVVVMDLVGVKNIVKSEEVTLYHPEGGELPFLNIHRFLTSIGVPIPRVLAEDVGAGYVILEDLGDELLLAASADAARPAGHGLRNIQDRARALASEARFISPPEGGAEVRVAIPRRA